MRRRDVSMRSELQTAQVRGVYEATYPFPKTVLRLLVVDKENGGRADALNAALDAAVSPYFITVDADSILDAQALKQVMRIFQDRPDVLAAGGQVGIVNDCTVERGRIVRKALTHRYVPLCQTLEYLRSFTTMRTGWTRLDSLVILSGAFLVMSRAAAIRVGGFLTGRVRYRLLDEYVGPEGATICEDMEMIVRLHRYEREHGRKARIVHTPVPVCWTEVPATLSSLAKQRRRWHRGLIEILLHHRRMVLNPCYGSVGLFALPYFVLFELAGPYVEAAGYVLLPLFALWGILDPLRCILITAVALAFGVLQSMVAVLCATWLEPVSPAGTQVRSLTGMDRWRDRLLLLAACFLGELGFRQLTVWWRLRGTWDFLRGRTDWDKFERAGFRQAAGAAGAALLAAWVLAAPHPTRAQQASPVVLVGANVATPAKAGAPIPAKAGAAITAQASAAARTETTPAAAGAEQPRRPDHALQEREVTVNGGSEHRISLGTGWWMEATSRWKWDDGQVRWVGLSRIERRGLADEGLLAGIALKPWKRAGFAVELRAAPGAEVSPRWFLSAEAEAAFHERISSTTIARLSAYRDVTVLDLATGTVLYLRKERWLATRAHLFSTWFDSGARAALLGVSGVFSTPLGASELRLQASYGGESYLAGYQAEVRELRAWSLGGSLRRPVGDRWTLELGAAYRRPELGAREIDVSGGVRCRW